MDKYTLVSRDSFLALAQTLRTASLLDSAGIPWELKTLKTQGDINLADPLYAMKTDGTKPGEIEKEGKSFFTKELENALLENHGDIAVHSLKDLSTDIPDGLRLDRVFERESSSDMLVTVEPLPTEREELAERMNQARIGSSSLRRAAQLKSFFPDVELNNVRGNLITRFEKLLNPETNFDMLLLAAAGIKRLFAFYEDWKNKGAFWESRIPGETFTRLQNDFERLRTLVGKNLNFYEVDSHTLLPAVGQGTLALETRTEENILDKAIPESPMLREKVNLERSIMSGLSAGCHIPLGIDMQPLRVSDSGMQPAEENDKSDSLLFETGVFFSPTFSAEAHTAGESAFRAKRYLTPDRVSTLIEEMFAPKGLEIPVVYTGKSAKSLENVIHVPFIETTSLQPQTDWRLLNEYSIIAVTSREAARYLLDQNIPAGTPVIAAGKKTAELLSSHFSEIDFPQEEGGAAGIVEKLLQKDKSSEIYWVGAENGIQSDLDKLHNNNYTVHAVYPYKNTPIAQEILERTLKNNKTELHSRAWWIFASPSAAEHYLNLNYFHKEHLIATIGQTTALPFLQKGIYPYVISNGQSLENLLDDMRGNRSLPDFQLHEWRIEK